MCRPCGIIARRPVAGLVCGLCGAGEDNRHALLRFGEGACSMPISHVYTKYYL